MFNYCLRYAYMRYRPKRLSHEFPDIRVFRDGISPTDIYQGSLGNCYLLSAISAIAEFPSRITRIIRQRKKSPKSAYCIALCITGQFEEIYLDDIVLCRSYKVADDYGRVGLAFAQNKEGEMWTILIEKAYAKAYGGYHNIGIGGSGDLTLFDLTGAPSECINFAYISVESGKLRKAKTGNKNLGADLTDRETDLLFERLWQYDQMGYIMSCGTREFSKEEMANYQKRVDEAQRSKTPATVEMEFGNGLYTTHA